MDLEAYNSKRRSSNRSIKRKKFDDELVEYSLGIPGLTNIKGARGRPQSVSSILNDYSLPLTPTPPPTPIAVPTTTPVVVDSKRKLLTKTVVKRNKRGRYHGQFATKDLGRWKPTDDLALIIGVQQTKDLRAVHLGTKFSCKFTVQELQQRWYALLYDQPVSRVAVAAMRNIHPDMVAAVQDRALWSVQEDQLLGTIKSHSQPTISVFAELLSQHHDDFYASRTPRTLQCHWNTMRLYYLLPDQTVLSLPTSFNPPVSFSDAEDSINDADLTEPCDENGDRELRLEHRLKTHEVRQLENEIARLNVLVDSVTGVCPGELDGQTLAVLRGRLVRYLMRSREITIGRSTKHHRVDVDLTLEGPAEKVSRRQGTLRLRNNGEFFLSSEGKRPIFVDGCPIGAGNKTRLFDNSVVEFASLKFIFCINQEIIRVIHKESLRYNITT